MDLQLLWNSLEYLSRKRYRPCSEKWERKGRKTNNSSQNLFHVQSTRSETWFFSVDILTRFNIVLQWIGNIWAYRSEVTLIVKCQWPEKVGKIHVFVPCNSTFRRNRQRRFLCHSHYFNMNQMTHSVFTNHFEMYNGFCAMI